MKSSIGTPLLVCGAIALAGCCLHGSGELEEETRVVAPFTGITLRLPGTVYVHNGKAGTLTLKTDENILSHVSTEVTDGRLTIGPTSKNDCLDPTELEVHVATHRLRDLEITGSGRIVLVDSFDTEAINVSIEGTGEMSSDAAVVTPYAELDIEGSGKIAMDVEAGILSSSISGFGEMRLTGHAASHDIRISGSGEIDASALATQSTTVDIDGMGTCYVDAAVALNVSIEGSGTVFYTGDAVVTQSLSGPGTVQKRD